jgi:hypothetical protein
VDPHLQLCCFVHVEGGHLLQLQQEHLEEHLRGGVCVAAGSNRSMSIAQHMQGIWREGMWCLIKTAAS